MNQDKLSNAFDVLMFVIAILLGILLINGVVYSIARMWGWV